MTEVSACIIAYEENDDLRRCLESIKGYVDEIILVNTGPFDFTEFCPEYTSKIFNDPWRDDFARARNLSLEKAKGGWILFIDSDEYLSSNGLLQELSGLDGDAFIIEQHNLREDGSIIINDKQIRVFRNIGFRFVGASHERLVDDKMNRVKSCGTIKGSILFHTGHSTDEVMEAKFKRNLKILKSELAKHPDFKTNYFFLARNYYNQARYDIFRKGRISPRSLSLLKKAREHLVKYYSFPYADTVADDADNLDKLCKAVLLFKDYDMQAISLLRGEILSSSHKGLNRT